MNPIKWLQRRSAGTEDAHEYDGVFSYAGEYHAAALGLAIGFTAATTGQPMLLAGLFAVSLGISGVDFGTKFKGRYVAHELKREPWYAVAGGGGAYLAAGGTVLEVAAVLPI